MDTPQNPIIKSLSDQREYVSITLPNQLQCLIIRDEDAELSSAALSMGVGSFKDPMTSQGIAHYLEHMLFMGTEKYPDENDYSEYITKNSGSNNAYTSQEETNYHLEITSGAFQGALDRFAQFFISPLMSESSSARELNAVNSEHAKNILNDSWRKFNLSKHISKPESPYNKFSTGNIKSLTNQNLPKILRDFYDQNYSANLMKLVIYGREDIDTLKKWIIQKFSAIPNKNLIRFRLPECPFDDRAMGKIFRIVPIKDKKTIELSWVLPDKKEHYRNHPGRYVSHLIGHQGKGSLLSLLMKQGLATSLSAGSYDNFQVYNEFSVSMDLTEEGVKNIMKIIGFTLFYIENLKKNGVQEWIFQQIQLINKIRFDYMDKKKGMMNTARIAKVLHTRLIQQVNIQPYLMETWKPQVVQQFLNELTLSNLIVYVEAKQFASQCHLQEPIYGTKYNQALTGAIEPIQCDIGLPLKNNFIPTDLEVLPMAEKSLPKQIFQSPLLQFHFKPDHEFNLPKVNLSVRAYFKGNNSVRQQILRTMMTEMLKEDLREFVYLAETADIEVNVNFVSFFAMEIKLKGFRDSVIKFLNEYMKRLLEYVPSDKALFETLKAKNKRKYANHFLEDPYRLVYDQEICAIRSGASVPAEEKVKQIDQISIEDLIHFSKVWNSSLFAEGYIGGNITEQSAQGLISSFNTLLSVKSKPLKKDQISSIRAVNLPENTVCIIERPLQNKEEENAGICVHFQGTESTHRSQVIMKILQSVAKQPAFDYLRTKEQLGYIVFCMAEDHRGVQGLTLIIQSSVKTSFELRSYINIFIHEKLREILDNMTEENFKNYRESLFNAKSQKDKNLAAESTRFWGEIVKHKLVFNRKEIELELIPQITLAEFKKHAEDLIYNQPKRLEVHVNPSKTQQLNQKVKEQQICAGEKDSIRLFDSCESFTKRMPLLQDYYSHQ